MNKRELHIDYFIAEEKYPKEYEKLCHFAEQSCEKSYCIYSEFSVGAAVLLENDVIIDASNQENIAYPSGMCAERIALYYAKSQYPDLKIKAIALAAKQNAKLVSNLSPCGACRQVMAEYIRKQNDDFDVIMLHDGKYITIKASQLLPFTFNFKK